MPMVVNALGAARVPVIVVTDFDILRNRAKLKQLIEAKGSSFDHVETWWNTVSSHLNSKYAPLNKSSLRDALIAALDAIPGEQVDRDAANSLKSYLKPNDGWSQAKISGVACLVVAIQQTRVDLCWMHWQRLGYLSYPWASWSVSIRERAGMERRGSLRYLRTTTTRTPAMMRLSL